MKPITNKLIFSILFFCVNASSLSAQTGTDIDGNSYTIELTRVKGKNKGSSWKTDTFKFDSGEMISVTLQEREGFESASYFPLEATTDSTESSINFSYESYNKYGSKLQIDGRAHGNVIEGTAIWTNMHGPRTYTFEGTLSDD
jgi:hypothetical protein